MNNVFYDVEIMTITANKQYQNEFEFNTDFFFSPHIGIIRKVTHDTVNGLETWNLKQYNIK